MSKPRLRDSQRSKVYRAESSTWGDLNEMRRLVDVPEAEDILGLLMVEFDTSPVVLNVNTRIKAWGGWYKRWEKEIEIPRNKVKVSTILHEFAHHLAYEREVGHEGHGGGFTEAMIDVVTAWDSAHVAALLADSYKRCGVKVGGHHVLAKDEAKQESRNKDGEERDVYMVGWRTAGFYADDTQYYAVTTTGWFDEETRYTHNAKLYLTERGARKAAAKLQGSKRNPNTGEEVTIKVYKTRARWAHYMQEWVTRAELDEQHLEEL